LISIDGIIDGLESLTNLTPARPDGLNFYSFIYFFFPPFDFKRLVTGPAVRPSWKYDNRNFSLENYFALITDKNDGAGAFLVFLGLRF